MKSKKVMQLWHQFGPLVHGAISAQEIARLLSRAGLIVVTETGPNGCVRYRETQIMRTIPRDVFMQRIKELILIEGEM